MMDRIEMMDLKTYQKVLEHRRNCLKWTKEFCIECFGGGLSIFMKDALSERGEGK